MDEVLEQKIADLAQDIIWESEGSESQSIVLAERAADLLLRLVRDILNTIPSKKDRLS